MKEFKTRNSQISAMGRYIKRNVDLDMKCQLCKSTKDVKILYSHNNIYEIHTVCNNCIKKYNVYHKIPDEKYLNTPWIDIREHLNKENTVELNKENINILNELATSNLNLYDILNKYKITYSYLKRLVILADEEYPGTKQKIQKHLSEVRKDRIRETKNKKSLEVSLNNITKLKLEYKYTDDDIVEKSNNTITKSAISNISRGVVTPKIGTKIIIAKAFGVSVTDVFPEELWFTEVFNEQDYILYIKDLIKRLKDKIQAFRKSKIKRVIPNLSEHTGITQHRIYKILSNKTVPTTEEITKLETFISD